MEKTLQELVQEIVQAVRLEVAKVPNFDNGAIRILLVPKCADTEHWLGDHGVDETICEHDFGYVIKKGASHTRPNGWRGEDDGECDCYGYAALKTAGCSYAIKHGLGYRSSDCPNEAVTWGRENDAGCVGYDVSRVYTHGHAEHVCCEPYLRVYISVSGASSDEDELCALAGGVAIEQWCNKDLVPHHGGCEQRLYITGRPA
jgi:hypothetical protein